MYPSMTTASPDGQQPAEAARGFARQLRMQADGVDAVREQVRCAEAIGWESPAGRNFRSLLHDRSAELVAVAALLREAAVSMDGYSAALETAEAADGLGV